MDTLTERQDGKSNQDAQRELVERAQSLPGVAEVIAVYEHLAPYTNVVSFVQQTQVHYATGGNQ